MYPMAVCLSICQRVYLSAVCSLYPFGRTKHYVKNNKGQNIIINAIICVHRLAPQLPSFTAFPTKHILFFTIICYNMTIQFQFNDIILNK